MRDAACDTDNLMIRAKLKISIHQKNHFNGVKVHKQIDISKLRYPLVRNKLKSTYDQVDFSDCDWKRVSDIIYEKGVEILGLRVPSH